MYYLIYLIFLLIRFIFICVCVKEREERRETEREEHLSTVLVEADVRVIGNCRLPDRGPGN